MPKADIGFRQSSEWVDVRGGHLGAEAAMPAMAAAVTKRLWEMSDVVNMLKAWEASNAAAAA